MQPRFDIVSLHGVWMAMHATAANYAKRAGIPLLLTPHGSLDPWALTRSGFRKRVARRLYVDSVLRTVDCFHALNEPEASALRTLGLTAPIAVVPNGVDIPPDVRAAPDGPTRTLLFLGRLHKKKGIRELVRAWTVLSNALPEWEFVVAGPDEQHLLGELQAESRGARIRFVGEVRGVEKHRLLRSASAFVLPSFSEGLPLTVLEAWSYGLPVFMSRECNLPDAFATGAAIEVRPQTNHIVSTLRASLAMPEVQLRSFGTRGRELVEREYSWARVATELTSVYAWLLGRSGRPSCLRTQRS